MTETNYIKGQLEKVIAADQEAIQQIKSEIGDTAFNELIKKLPEEMRKLL